MVLEKGATGEEVYQLQHRLVRLGYWYGGNINGKFDDITEKHLMYFQETHINQDGRFLLPDGVLGPKTQWALDNPFGANQRNYIDAKIPNNIGEMRTHILEIAVRERMKNIRENPLGSNAGPILKYGGQPGWAWCALFVSWVWREALGVHRFGKQASCHKLFDVAKKEKAVVQIKDAVPGDAYVILHKNGTGHTGLVLRMPLKGDDRFNTISGNEANRVKLGTRRFGDKDIAGAVRIVDIDGLGEWEHGILETASTETDSTR
ncbi:MAG: peptidoglycan-binding protein [Synergistaceae bacterium]|jgi:hypothetical protein|nr:peptidoglycan-binding protein [Synergistaceae bacterium]